jgi:hypothetical protein
VSIPTLLVCDGDDAKQEILEGLVKRTRLEIHCHRIKSDGRAVEQAIKVGTNYFGLTLMMSLWKASTSWLKLDNFIPSYRWW